MIDRGYRGKLYPDKLNCVLRELAYEPSKAIMIGDTFMDIKMAKNSDTFALGASWGYHDEQTLFAHDADAVASSVSQVREIVQRILG